MIGDRPALRVSGVEPPTIVPMGPVLRKSGERYGSSLQGLVVVLETNTEAHAVVM